MTESSVTIKRFLSMMDGLNIFLLSILRIFLVIPSDISIINNLPWLVVK